MADYCLVFNIFDIDINVHQKFTMFREDIY